jgi:hypothetical protein
MSDSKSFASLSSALLARKGHAKPAMRPQAIQLGQTPTEQLEDLGWNDMGHEPAPLAAAELATLPGVQPLESDAPVAVHVQQEELARELGAREFVAPEFVEPHNPPAPQPSMLSPMRAPRAAPGSKAKAAFTLRLDAERHLQLRLVCAVKHRSAQQIVTEALDQFLARQPEVADNTIRTRR